MSPFLLYDREQEFIALGQIPKLKEARRQSLSLTAAPSVFVPEAAFGSHSCVAVSSAKAASRSLVNADNHGLKTLVARLSSAVEEFLWQTKN